MGKILAQDFILQTNRHLLDHGQKWDDEQIELENQAPIECFGLCIRVLWRGSTSPLCSIFLLFDVEVHAFLFDCFVRGGHPDGCEDDAIRLQLCFSWVFRGVVRMQIPGFLDRN